MHVLIENKRNVCAEWRHMHKKKKTTTCKQLSRLTSSFKTTELRLWKPGMKYSFKSFIHHTFMLTKWKRLTGQGCGPGFSSVIWFIWALERFYGVFKECREESGSREQPTLRRLVASPHSCGAGSIRSLPRHTPQKQAGCASMTNPEPLSCGLWELFELQSERQGPAAKENPARFYQI